MRTATLLILLCCLPGCFPYSAPREYSYDLDLRNATDRPVSMEVLRIESGSVGKIRADLAPGGLFSDAFTTRNSAEYLEARLRFLDVPEPAPRWIAELPQGRTRSDIVVNNGRITLNPCGPRPGSGHTGDSP